ncbi:uncharacterized protein (DUF2267 family) [Hoeflea marina]|uniref:Uncharacterized protein (DUF2267 family) n=2 Tax=Hoeflea marina TaxID=274592 RepID=A0A317PWW3_9HYPH|nr:uncharacterized protein (DUF2267 family) [Hoeflea marina]
MLAQQRFDALLVNLMERLDLTTRHQVYAVLFAFLRVFRRRLDADQTLVFAGVLPAIVSAIFISDWMSEEARRPFADVADIDEEIRGVRRDHNLAPRDARRIVAASIRSGCDPESFEAVLAKLPDPARAFWD